MTKPSAAIPHADQIRKLWAAGVQAKHIAFQLRITEGAVKGFVFRARELGEGWAAKKRPRGPRRGGASR